VGIEIYTVYVKNDPLRFRDPLGMRRCHPLVGGIVGGLIGGVAGAAGGGLLGGLGGAGIGCVAGALGLGGFGTAVAGPFGAGVGGGIGVVLVLRFWPALELRLARFWVVALASASASVRASTTARRNVMSLRSCRFQRLSLFPSPNRRMKMIAVCA